MILDAECKQARNLWRPKRLFLRAHGARGDCEQSGAESTYIINLQFGIFTLQHWYHAVQWYLYIGDHRGGVSA